MLKFYSRFLFILNSVRLSAYEFSMEKEEISGFILAGGKSSRMGRDKALLEFQGQTLLAHMLELIKPFCASTFISGNNPEYQQFGFEIIPDIYADKGPISGIFSILSFSQSEWNLIVSVDVPMVNPELLLHLIENRNSYDAVVPVHSQGTEPLIALYHKHIIPVIQEMIQANDYKLMNLIRRINTNHLDCNELICRYPHLFLNVNKLDDYQAIQALGF